MGLVVHGMAGFDRGKARATLRVPDDYEVEAMVAVGHPGDPAMLPPQLRAREAPSNRKPVGESPRGAVRVLDLQGRIIGECGGGGGRILQRLGLIAYARPTRPLADGSGDDASPEVVRRHLDLIEEAACDRGGLAQTLFPRSDGHGTHRQQLGEDLLAGPDELPDGRTRAGV